MKERVPGKTEVMDLPQGTVVYDYIGVAWVVGSRDGSCVNMSSGEDRCPVRFYAQVRMIDGEWRFTNDAGKQEAEVGSLTREAMNRMLEDVAKGHMSVAEANRRMDAAAGKKS